MIEKVRTFTAFDRYSYRYQIDEWQEFTLVFENDLPKWKAVRRHYQIGNEIVAKCKGNVFRKLDGTILLKI